MNKDDITFPTLFFRGKFVSLFHNRDTCHVRSTDQMGERLSSRPVTLALNGLPTMCCGPPYLMVMR